MNKILAHLICVTILVLRFPVMLAHAQSVGLSIDPPVVEILLAPNKKLIQAFEIKNQGEKGDFAVTLHAVTPEGTFGHVAIDRNPLDMTTIPLVVKLQNANLELGKPFTIDAGNSQQIVISIEGASTDETTDAYFAVVVQSMGSVAGDITSSAGISGLVLTTLTPSGSIPVNMTIENFNPPLIHDSSTPLVFRPELKNNSTSMLRPEGKLEIISPRGNHNSEIKLFPNLVLKNSSRTLVGATGEPPQGIPLTWRPSLANIGPYTFRLTVTTPGGTKIQAIEGTVWLFPIRKLVGLLAVIILGTTIYSMRSRKNDSAKD